MNDIGSIELEILSLAQQGQSRVEFKRNAAEKICTYFSCSGIDIYIHEGEIDYTWSGRMDSNGGFIFIKADEESEPTTLYRNYEKSITLDIELNIFGDDKVYAVMPIIIDQEKNGLVIYIRDSRKPFSPEEYKVCKTISAIFAAAISFRNTQAALRERIKELTCLYEITKIMQKSPDSIEKTLHETIKNIPLAFQYEDIATSRIFLDDKEYTCGVNADTPYSLKSDIVIGGISRGHVEVMYNTRGHDLEEKSFLIEEQNLLDGIAKQLSFLIEDQEAAEEKKQLEHQLRHADRLATIGQLAAGVAHEINEPLANILGFSELIKKDTGLSEQTHKDTNKIIDAAMFARDTVKKLLVFASQIQPGEMEINLNTIVAEGIQFFKMRCKKENIVVSTNLDPSIPFFIADSGQLNQVLINLVVNAMQAMPDGGNIDINTGMKEKSIFLSIQDSGTGIAEEIRDKIFLPFFTTKETGKGTGLGLAVVHGIINAYKGTIEVQSKKNEGTQFTIYIPVGKKDGTKENNPCY